MINDDYPLIVTLISLCISQMSNRCFSFNLDGPTFLFDDAFPSSLQHFQKRGQTQTRLIIKEQYQRID